jgi:hypothetical protein
VVNYPRREYYHEVVQKMDTLDVPKPTACDLASGVGRATFDLEELKQFVQETKDTRLVVRNEVGEVVGVLRVQPIREFLALEKPPV